MNIEDDENKESRLLPSDDRLNSVRMSAGFYEPSRIKSLRAHCLEYIKWTEWYSSGPGRLLDYNSLDDHLKFSKKNLSDPFQNEYFTC